MKESILSGRLIFKNNESIFYFKENTLVITPLSHTLEAEGGRYVIGGQASQEELPSVIEGRLLDDSSKVIFFFIRSLRQRTGLLLDTYKFNVDKYIIAKDSEMAIDGMSIYAEELNWFYNIRKAYN